MKRRKLTLTPLVCSAMLFTLVLFVPVQRLDGQTAISTRMAPQAKTESFKSLASFLETNGENPANENLVQGEDGNLYGTTPYGGAPINGVSYDLGEVFNVTPTGKITVLHTFSGTDGANPLSGLVLATDGNFYGTTYQGGVDYLSTGGYGTVFKVAISSTGTVTFTTIYNFAGSPDGSLPEGALIQGSDGNLYGTTAYGGNDYCTFGCGTVFQMTTSGTLNWSSSFSGMNSSVGVVGAQPLAGLVQASDGNFYGTTAGGGTPSPNNYGTVFSVTPSGTLTNLVSFDIDNGWEPESPLIQATNGAFYGTTIRGGANGLPDGDGEIFELTSANTLTLLHSFDLTDGYEPQGGVIQATDGNFYGTTYSGGTGEGEVGTIFRISPAGKLNNFSFDGTDGAYPDGGLVQYTSGAFFGLTSLGGSGPCAGGCGTVFTASVGLGQFVKLLPASGAVGSTITIVGNGLTGAAAVSFNGTAAKFTVASGGFTISATVPSGAASGKVSVKLASGTTIESNVSFAVAP